MMKSYVPIDNDDTDIPNIDIINIDIFNRRLLSGSIFKRIFCDILFIKLTNETETHNGFKFESGINVDIHEFNSTDECSKGGIYFIDEQEAWRWLYYNKEIGIMRYIRRVFIPNDAKVYVEANKFKADKLILGDRIEVSRTLWQTAAKKCIGILQHIPEFLIDKIMYRDAVKIDGRSLQFVPDDMKDSRLCKDAVINYSNALQFVPESIMNKDICREAVKRNAGTLQYVPHHLKDWDMCIKAVRQKGLALQFVPELIKDIELCLEAINQDPNAIQFVPARIKFTKMSEENKI